MWTRGGYRWRRIVLNSVNWWIWRTSTVCSKRSKVILSARHFWTTQSSYNFWRSRWSWRTVSVTSVQNCRVAALSFSSLHKAEVDREQSAFCQWSHSRVYGVDIVHTKNRNRTITFPACLQVTIWWRRHVYDFTDIGFLLKMMVVLMMILILLMMMMMIDEIVIFYFRGRRVFFTGQLFEKLL